MATDTAVDPPSGFRERSKRILALALPIIGGMASQNVLNLIDTAMVGQLGAAALGATGLGGTANWLAAAFFLALGTGVQVVASRRVGQGDERGAVAALHAALLVAALIVLPYSLVLARFSEPIFGLLSSDPDVVSQGAPYLAIRLSVTAFYAANFSFRGYWNGIGRSMLYLRTIVVIHATNIVLNWVLIYGNLGAPEMGVSGAGLASAIAVVIGTLTYVVLAWRHSREHGFGARGNVDADTARSVVRLSVPAGVRGIFFAGGIMAFFRIAELLGTEQLAASNAIINLAMVCMLPALGYGLAAATFVGRSLGEARPDEARRWAWTTVLLAVVTLSVLGLVLVAAPTLWIDLLMDDPPAEALAVAPLVLVALYQPIDAVGQVLSNALVGAGAVRTEAVATLVTQWGLLLPLGYVWSVELGGGLLALWASMCLWRVCSAGLMTVIFRRGRWARIEV